MAGLLAARVLADHFDRVTLLERDRFPDGPEARKGLPQARHIHVLLASGRRALERLLPNLIPDLVDDGAVGYDAIADVEWISPGGLCPRYPSDLRMLGATRDFLDWGVRRQLKVDGRVLFRTDAHVTGLLLDRAGRHVSGVTVADRAAGGATEEIGADLVVDAAGRGSRTPQWLEAHGYPRPQEMVVNGFLGYSSRLVRPPDDWPRDWTVFYIQCAPPARRRGGAIASVEAGRWIVTLIGGGKDYPPTDDDGFREFARSLPDPRFAEAYEAAEPLSPIAGTKSTENRLRRYEKLSRWPEGLIVTGDAACAFNPVYGQGMSAAAVAAVNLDECLRRRRSGDLIGLAAQFQARLARANARPWLLATGEDYRYDEAEGPPANRLTRLSHRYLNRVTALAVRTPWVHRRLIEVLHLVRSPASLFAPEIMALALFTRS